MEWIEVFVSTSQMGLEPVEGVLYQCGLTGLMIHDTSDFAEFLENPNREWDYVADELVEEKNQLETGITFFLRDNLYGREQLEAAGKPFAKAPQHEAVLDAYSQCRSRSPALCNELGSLSVLIRSTTTGSHSHRSHTYYRGNPSNP